MRVNVKSSGEKALQYLNESLAGFVESNIYEKNDFFLERYASKQNQLNHFFGETPNNTGNALQVDRGLCRAGNSCSG